ncbi:MAG TPA: GxxExxY protein [Tepidisphaeraceae bacterium]|jgi:GxxExxY protein
MPELLYKQEVYAIVGAAMDVYNELGSGFLESVYQEAMEWELSDRTVPFQPQVLLRIKYKERVLKKTFCADLICFGAVLVELKCIERIGDVEEAQVLNYLKATGLRLGVIINFGDPGQLDWKRVIL